MKIKLGVRKILFFIFNVKTDLNLDPQETLNVRVWVYYRSRLLEYLRP